MSLIDSTRFYLPFHRLKFVQRKRQTHAMKGAKYIGLGLLALLAIGAVATTTAIVKSQTTGIADKFLFDFGSFAVHKVDFSGITVSVSGIKIYNQSSFSASISNLYVNPKYAVAANNYSPLVTQESFNISANINANSATTLPTILFKLTTANLITLYSMYTGSISKTIFVNVRFQVLGGYEISLDQQVDLTGQIAFLKSLFNNPVVQMLLGKPKVTSSLVSQPTSNYNYSSNNVTSLLSF